MPTNQKTSLTPTRVAIVVIAGMVGAALIIGIAVLLTPLPEIDEEAFAEMQAGAGSPNATGNGNSLAGGSASPALPSANRFIEVEPASLNLATEAETLDVEALRGELIGLADRLRSDFPKDPVAWHISAQTLAELNQTSAAQATWEDCVALEPDLPGPYAGLAQLYSTSGRDQQAVDLLNDALLRGVDSAELRVSLGEAHENLGELAEAREVLSLATRKFPDYADAHLALGRVLNQLGEHEKAETSLLAAIALDGETQPALFALSTAQVRQGKRDEAKKTQQLLDALKSGPNNPNAFQSNYNASFKSIAHRIILAAASAYENTGNLNASEELVRRAIRLDPNGLKAYMSLSSIYLRQQKIPEALAVHRILLDKQPENLLNAINVAAIALDMGNVELAESTLKSAQSRDQQNVLVQVGLAKLYLQLNRFEEARNLAAAVVENAPSAESYMLLAAAYDGAGQTDAAKAAMERAQSLLQQLASTSTDPTSTTQPSSLQINDLQPGYGVLKAPAENSPTISPDVAGTNAESGTEEHPDSTSNDGSPEGS